MQDRPRTGAVSFLGKVPEKIGHGSDIIVQGMKSRLSDLYPSRNIFESEWDVLVVLDGCRFDLMAEIATEFDYLAEIEQTGSVGSKTTEWMKKTFRTKYASEMAETVHVTGNPNSAKFLRSDDFSTLDEVWQYAWDDDVGTIPMRPITERAITLGRKKNPNRLLVHYMQPHEPFLSDPDLGGSDTIERKTGQAPEQEFRSVRSRLEAGELSKDTVRDHYAENLRYALEELKVLTENIDAETFVITSDHGNAFGEWRTYGHPAFRPIPSLRRVPWVKCSTTDTGAYEPDELQITDVTGEVESRLKDLGYK